MANPFTIGIAGGSGSGKSTVVRRVAEAVGDYVAVLEMDAYYKDQSNMPFEERVKVNYDHPFAFDIDLFISHIKELKQGRPIDKPTYSFSEHTRISKVTRVNPAGVVIIDGILVLEDERVRALMEMKVYVDTDADVRFIRRLVRDTRDRGRTTESVIRQYLDTVRPMHNQFVEPTKRYADIIVPEGGFNNVAIEMLIAGIRNRLGR